MTQRRKIKKRQRMNKGMWSFKDCVSKVNVLKPCNNSAKFILKLFNKFDPMGKDKLSGYFRGR